MAKWLSLAAAAACGGAFVFILYALIVLDLTAIAGSIISTSAALLAAVLAWKSVQKQIERQDREDVKVERRRIRTNYIRLGIECREAALENFQRISMSPSWFGEDVEGFERQVFPPEMPSAFTDYDVVGALTDQEAKNVALMATKYNAVKHSLYISINEQDTEMVILLRKRWLCSFSNMYDDDAIYFLERVGITHTGFTADTKKKLKAMSDDCNLRIRALEVSRLKLQATGRDGVTGSPDL